MNRKQSPTRLDNLEVLIREAGSAARLARAAGTNSSYLSQVRNQLPTEKGTPRSIGDELASKLEVAMNKPHGWMDEIHNDKANINAEHDAYRTRHPLISWDDVGKDDGISEDTPPYTIDYLVCPVECSPETFVLRVRGSSMEPKFREGELIFVDPAVQESHGKYVVVRLEEHNEVTFKQLIREDGKKYLKTLNPDWPDPIVSVTHRMKFCGVIVFKGEAL